MPTGYTAGLVDGQDSLADFVAGAVARRSPQAGLTDER